MIEGGRSHCWQDHETEESEKAFEAIDEVPEYARALRLGTVRAEVGPLRQVVEVSNKALLDASEKKEKTFRRPRSEELPARDGTGKGA